MIELTLQASQLEQLSRLYSGDVERCAVILATQTSRSDGSTRLLAQSIEFPADEHYVVQSRIEAQLSPEFVASITKRARLNGKSLIFVHSHIGDIPPVFSQTDDAGEKQLSAFLLHRHPKRMHAALVVSASGVAARVLGTSEKVQVIALGDDRRILYPFDSRDRKVPVNELYDRQIRAFGASAQKELQQLRIGIVGLGGTGSLIAQQLAHLGVQNLLFIDPDTIELTNLNRVVGARPNDVDTPKVEAARKLAQEISPEIRVQTIVGDITHSRIAKALVDVDLIFGCTDSHGSRSVLQQIAYQYLIPCIDMGVTIAVKEGAITAIVGRVQLLAPGHACLSCSNLLSPQEVRRDMMSDFERKLDPYIQGVREPAPAVISINSTVSSLAITMLMAHALDLPSKGRHLIYDARLSVLRNVRATSNPDCYICSASGVLARGDELQLFARQD